jgi:hypothetical protein
MSVALILQSPPTILAVYPAVPNPLVVPGGGEVFGAAVGWTDAAHALVAVVPFVVPAGMQTTGPVSYSISGSVVSEVYSTVSNVPPPSPTSTVISSIAFRSLFSLAELSAVTTSGQTSVPVRMFLDDVSASGQVDLNGTLVQSGMTTLQNAGLISAARAAAILSGAPHT